MSDFIRYNWFALLLLGAFAAFTVFVVIGTEQNAADFRRECERVGGNAMFDGRQWQCLQEKRL